MQDTSKLIQKHKKYLRHNLKSKRAVLKYFYGNELYMQLHNVSSLIDSIIDGRFISVKRIKFEQSLISNKVNQGAEGGNSSDLSKSRSVHTIASSQDLDSQSKTKEKDVSKND